MKLHTYWRGTHRHIEFEIWNSENYWAGYVFLNNHQCDINLKHDFIYYESGRKDVVYNTFDNPLLQVVDEVVRGGVTWTSITSEVNLRYFQTLKIGWDYSHGFSGHTEKERVYHDCVLAIDALWKFNPRIKVHCSTVGGYHELADGIINEEGEFVSKAGLIWRQEQGWD